MHARRCPQDGYAMRPIEEGGRLVGWMCSCPTHPIDPGPCPNEKCQSAGPHRSPGIGMRGMAMCDSCGAEWRVHDDPIAG
jgi:hypothetical protein